LLFEADWATKEIRLTVVVRMARAVAPWSSVTVSVIVRVPGAR
jgi:hypothetical protein